MTRYATAASTKYRQRSDLVYTSSTATTGDCDAARMHDRLPDQSPSARRDGKRCRAGRVPAAADRSVLP